MEASGQLWCEYCGRQDFRNLRGLAQHQRTNDICHRRLLSALGAEIRSPVRHTGQDDGSFGAAGAFPSPPQAPERALRRPIHAEPQPMEGAEASRPVEIDFGAFGSEIQPFRAPSSEEDDDDQPSRDSLSTLKSGSGQETDSNLSSEEESACSGEPNVEIRDQFKDYCRYARHNHIQFTEDEVASIRLMHLLQHKNAPLNAYQATMEWHLKESGKMLAHESLRDNGHYIGRKAILKKLTKRYNMEGNLPFKKKVKLPVSGAIAQITCHDAGAAVRRLLTDPRITSEDYLFFNQDPLAPPPENLTYVADLNTGRSYRDAYEALIKGPNEQLLPIVIYIDGTAISQFHAMEIVSVKIALGIMTREARHKEYLWTSLGYVEKINPKEKKDKEGQDPVQEVRHVEHQDRYHDEDDEDDEDEAMDMGGVGVSNEQDWHCMIDCILSGFVKLQETGLKWDLVYKDKIYPDILFRIFIPFIKCDTKEADTICGKYQNRNSTNQICRYCKIPLQKCNDHMANEAPKNWGDIQKLVDNADHQALKDLSQIYLQNAFYQLRFSPGSKAGVHGFCPSEILHQIQLGIFKYVKKHFFKRLGDKGSKKINALAKQYCKYFCRQSDRSLPNTNFSKGIMGGGKLMGKEYRGVLLIMVAVLRSTKGRAILNQYKAYKGDVAKDDWILLLELLLQWEAFLNEPIMELKHVKRLQKKHRYLMFILRRVAKRTEGMGLKLMKFHAILHMVEDIISGGVPMEFDTGANEGHHKTAKQAARLTQRAAFTFQFQAALRLIEFLLVDLAMQEIETGDVIWEYFSTYSEETASDSSGGDPNSGGGASDSGTMSEISDQRPRTQTGETQIRVFRDENDDSPSFQLVSRSKFADKTTWNLNLVDFLVDLQDKLQVLAPLYSLKIFTWHKRDDQIFRGHPNYRGKGHWRDWVWVDWGAGHGELPAHIWCFVVITDLPQNCRVQHGGIRLENGTFAVVESSTRENTEYAPRSELLEPYLLDIELTVDGRVADRSFCLANTEAFTDPCCAIPDIGGPKNRYFIVASRAEWKDEFILWLQAPHDLDVIDPLTSDEDSAEDSDDAEGLSADEDEDDEGK